MTSPETGVQQPSAQLRILIVTDAWSPQVNGVVRTLQSLVNGLKEAGHDVLCIEPTGYPTVPCPTYPEIRLALAPQRKVNRTIREFAPDAIHIATEGPLGFAARRYCVRNGLDFTSSFHTRFPEYIHARTRIPVRWSYRAVAWFHGEARRTLVSTPHLKAELEQRGFGNLVLWSRGVDVDVFRPVDKSWLSYARPIWLYVGRVAVEKNIEAFLALDLPGTKLVVGDGPQMATLKTAYPEAEFVGPKFGDELSHYYGASDVFVFPSRTDTFGLVVLEAMASGLPVAAYPVQGPSEIIGDAPVGKVHEDLKTAAMAALTMADPEVCRAHAMQFSWATATRQFVSHLALVRDCGQVPSPAPVPRSAP